MTPDFPGGAASSEVRPSVSTTTREHPAAGHDLAGWNEFCSRTRPHLVRYATHLVGDHHLAEDLVQDALLKLWKRWPQHHRWSSNLAYSKATVRNTFLDFVRLKHRQTIVDSEVVERELESLDDEHVALDHKALQRAVKSLPPRQREVITLIFFDGMKPAEVAEHLNISAKMAYKWKSLALERMRSFFENDS
ncbi:RNA polymerase sigma factor [Amycolatopsis thermoflava]|uniref:RNA polymerase sigma factor n=1 Tax=Amycolatopsis thermoflava TaxID=84480 RepID=UPI003F4A5A75